MRKHIIRFIAMFSILVVLAFYPLNYYISKPGGAYELQPLVTIEETHPQPKGLFHLMTISIAKATPLTYLYAQLSKEMDVLPVTSVKQEEEDDEEYSIRQKRLMYNSQNKAKIVAFNRAKRDYTVTYNGIYVIGVVKGSAAEGIIRPGDTIVQVNDFPLTEKQTFHPYIEKMLKGDQITLVIERNGKQFEKDITLAELPNRPGKVGLGIRYEDNEIVETNPNVVFESSSIGGPSAGLMFTLEIMNHLQDNDLTKGYSVAGTGEILEDGSVGRIGGIDFKVIAAHKQKIDIFFAPDDVVSKEMQAQYPDLRSNYEVAVETAERLKTPMQIVPVRTIDDALDYLEQLPPKAS